MKNKEEFVSMLNRFEMLVRASQRAQCSLDENKSLLEMSRLFNEMKDREFDIEEARLDLVSFC